MTKAQEGESVIDVKLNLLIDQLEEVESVLYGNGDKEGLRIDVDRLKRSRATHNAVLWLLFTTLVGIGGTVAAAMVIK